MSLAFESFLASCTLEEIFHQFVTLLDSKPGFGCVAFAKTQVQNAAHSRSGHGEGDRLSRVGAARNRRRMIGQHHYAPTLMLFERVKDRPHNVSIDLFDGFFFHIRTPSVGGFIRGLDVDKYQIVVVEGLDGGRPLPFVVRIDEARRTGHVDQIEAHQLG